jgi:predicted oxidoreductase
MQTTRVRLADSGPEVSRIAAGCWRLVDWGWGPSEVVDWVEVCLSHGITTFDHADIYGGYRAAALFGRALAGRPDLRDRIEIVTKCDIALVDPARPEHRVKHYDTTAAHLRAAVDGQLTELGVDRLDLLLLHRPDPLLDADEVAAEFEHLRSAGKVAHFGVSNFSPSQYDLLASRTPLVTNQVQHSLLHPDPLFDGTFDHCQQHRVRPMLWSPLGGGALFGGTDQRATRVRAALADLAPGYGVPTATLALAWLLAEPAGPVPLVSSSRPSGMGEAARACEVEVDRQDWFTLLAAATGTEVP